jgi:hypothetical protein
MIKFFRKIRQNLIMENKTSKYFKYAIGEIVLVVIGILIALQINNWNEGRLEKEKEKVIVANLHTEFKENLKDLDSIQRRLNTAIGACDIIFNLFKEDVSTYNTKSIDSLISLSLTSPSWKPSEFVLNDLQNSGGLSKLNSSELKQLLFRWSRLFNELKETNHDIEYTTSEYIKYIKDNGSMRNVDASDPTFKYERSKLQIDNLKLIQDFRFENYLDDKLFVFIEAKDQFQSANYLIQKILEATSEQSYD